MATRPSRFSPPDRRLPRLTNETIMTMTYLDFEEIRQLHGRYSHAIDFEDVDGLVGCFAAGGGFECPDEPDSTYRGQEELRRFAAHVAEGTMGHVRHSIMSSLIAGDGTRARSLSYALITRDFAPPVGKGQHTRSAVLTTGLYEDELARVGTRWVYAKRTFFHDGWPGVLERVRRPLELDHVDAGTSPSDGARGLSALDCEAIRQLLARFAYTLDFEDYDGLVDCFTPDGGFHSLTRPDMGGRRRFEGPDELREFATTVGQWVRGHARHGAVSVAIEGEDDGQHARVSSYSLIPMDYGTPRQPRQRDNATVGTTGLYKDDVVKVDGRWRFARRTFRYDGWPDTVARVGSGLDFEAFGS